MEIAPKDQEEFNKPTYVQFMRLGNIISKKMSDAIHINIYSPPPAHGLFTFEVTKRVGEDSVFNDIYDPRFQATFEDGATTKRNARIIIAFEQKDAEDSHFKFDFYHLKANRKSGYIRQALKATYCVVKKGDSSHGSELRDEFHEQVVSEEGLVACNSE